MGTPAVVLEVPVAAGDVDLLALHEHRPARYPVLLETAALASGAETQYDWLLIAAPESANFRTHEWRVSKEDVIARRLTGPRFLSELDTLHAAAADCHGPVAHGALPFVGGFFVYAAYELAGEVEPVLRLPLLEGDLIAALLPIAGAIVRHHGSGQLQVVALPAYAALANAVLADVLASTSRALRAVPDLTVNEARRVTEEEPERFIANVERGLQAITAGEVYQTNLSRAWHTQLLPGESAAALYHRLCGANPGPFAGIARLPGLSVLSTSPERLVRVRGLKIDTRPIAGTRPRRLGDAAADAALAAELRAHPKEQAEHVMLVDLERNDLGRLCEPGTVEVDEFMVLEHYAHVHHIVSNVRGIRRPDTTPGQVLRAVFPGGTITGCPKVRCMQLIADLEGVPRGAYTGTMGWLGLDGDMDLNILIRTAAVTTAGIVSVRAGAGIVADSVPLLELAETRAKARGLLRGLGVRLDDPA